MNQYQKFVLSHIGIDRYQLKNKSAINQKSPDKLSQLVNDQNSSSSIIDNQINAKEDGQLNWQNLTNQIKNCQKCELARERLQAVVGTGDHNPDWLFVGEGPGAEEDQQGLPFVGNSGKLLDNILLSVGLERGKKVYIANAVKCRPPGNRPPMINEISACQYYLHAQIALLNPAIIIAVGKSATVALIGDEKSPLGRYRQRHLKFQWSNFSNKFSDFHNLGEIPIVVTYHPSYLLRNLNDKLKSWEDLIFAIKLLNNQKNE